MNTTKDITKKDNYKIYYKESNVDDNNEYYLKDVKDWLVYFNDNNMFLGKESKHSKTDFYVYNDNKLIFDTRHGYNL